MSSTTKVQSKSFFKRMIPSFLSSKKNKKVQGQVQVQKQEQVKTAKDFKTAVMNRRTIYAISKDIKVSDEKLQEIVEFGINYSPSAFNSQSARAVLLLGKHHDKFWSITTEILRKMVPADKFAATEAKMKGFSSGYGTVLFFEDQEPVKKLQEQFPSYAHNFPVWSEQSSGMLQFIIWTALENEGLGASLQHYSPLVDESVQKEWDIPSNWKLVAQMPFGHPVQAAGPKEFQPIQDRVKIFKSNLHDSKL